MNYSVLFKPGWIACCLAWGLMASPLVAQEADPPGSESRRFYYPGTEELGRDEMRVIALGTGRPLVHVHLARFDTELQPALVEFKCAVQAQLIEFGRLLLIGQTHDLRTHGAGSKGEVRVAIHARDCIQVGRIQRTPGNRQTIVELELLSPEIRAGPSVAVACGWQFAREAECSLAAAGVAIRQ